MSSKKTLALLLTAATPLLSGPAGAASGKDGLDACVSRLAKAISEAQDAPVSVRISDPSKSMLRRLRGRTQFYLDAVDPASEEIVAKADCTVDRRAVVRGFDLLPEDAPLAEIRSL